MGMVNQLGKFSPQIVSLSKPLRELLSIKCVWSWGPDQEDAFARVKADMATPCVLAMCNLEAPTKIFVDASLHGLGAMLLQQEWRLIA